MSVIARQGFKYSIIGYLGFLLGTISAIFIFPFDMEFYGKLRYFLSTAEMFLPIVVFGLSFSNVKFFSKAQKDGKHQNMLTLSLVGVLVNFIFFCAGFYIATLLFPGLKSYKIWEFRKLVLPLILVLALSAVFNKYISNYKRIVIPNFFENVLPRIANLGAFCIFFFFSFSEKTAYIFFFAVFVIALVGYWFYNNRLEKFKPDFSTKYFKEDLFYRQILNYSFYGFLGNIGNFIAMRIDNFMISEYINFEENGIYNTLYAIISLITIPQIGLYNISAPFINKSLEENQMEELDIFHKKTSLTLFFLGLVLFSCVVVGFPSLTFFMKNGELFLQAQPVLWILGIAILFDLATGFNGHIISLSKYYRFNIAVMLLLAVMTVTLNMLFLKTTNLGIMGIALATAISLTLYNIIKIVFNYVKFGVFPLSIEMIYASLISTIAITIIAILPDLQYHFLNLIYKPFIIILSFIVGNYFLKIFPIENYINKKFLKSIFKL